MIWIILIETAIFLALAWWGLHSAAYSLSGMIVTALVLFVAVAGGDWVWGALVLLYLVSAIYWMHFGQQRKGTIFNRLLGRAQTDWRSVLGHLGWGIVLAVVTWVGRKNIYATSAFVGVAAMAVADTWASEIGALSQVKPKRLTSNLPSASGAPGAVSLLGLVSASGGAWLVGFTALICYFIMSLSNQIGWSNTLFWLPIGATLGGLVGTLVDSLLGGTAQGMYYCDHCQLISEEPVHTCGLPARQISGWRWLTNQGVDLVGSLVGAAVTVSIVLLASLSL